MSDTKRNDTYRRLALPVSEHRWLYIDGPFPMPVCEFDALLHLLTTMRPGLVDDDTTISDEGNEDE